MFFSLSLSPFLCWNTYSPRGICLFSVWKVMLISLSNLQVQFLGASALHDCIQRLMVLVKGWWSRDVVAKNGCLTSGCTSFGKDVHLLSKSREKHENWLFAWLVRFSALCRVEGASPDYSATISFIYGPFMGSLFWYCKKAEDIMPKWSLEQHLNQTSMTFGVWHVPGKGPISRK